MPCKPIATLSLVAINAFTVANNTIITTNGRGIDIDGWSATPITNGEIYGNYVDVAEKKTDRTWRWQGHYASVTTSTWKA